ncbi:hypothetical protein RND71_017219 [Anisodus tanguticus]|uniref:Phosphatase PP2A regulatory subunit A/Splicing factor 3B subunit 1-like HEAT repeat domain-containing protein n=1 Tax=Anisodus tanguticus TaxID=243964 RepID=A0AAE1S1V1_9SOLA|nr:hypothetical protein RND71_017219 [Anisodus tanguticus]
MAFNSHTDIIREVLQLTMSINIYSIAVLIDELENDDVFHRLNSMRHLSTIAQALGAERTRTELIPFLTENNIDDDEEEVLLTMIEQLGVFIPLVGGVEHASALLPPLESLCSIEEACVRDKTVESLCIIGSQMREPDLIESFIPLSKRLAAGEWFTTRISSCGLFHIAYPKIPEPLRNDLRAVYSQLCHDDMPLVRKAAAINLGKFAATVEQPYLKTDIMSMFKDLRQDGQDSVRLFAVKSCAALGKLLELPVCLAELLPIIVEFAQELSSDSSEHVRSALASDIMGLAPILGQDATIEHLLPVIHSLLKDNFSEVRLNIISKLDQINQVIGIDLLSQSLLSVIVELTDIRHSWRVRHAMIEFIPILASQLGVGIYNDNLGALCMQWLKDKVCAIREAAGKNLKRLAEIFGRAWALEHIIPQVLSMVDDKYSLYRMNILHVLLNLAPVMGSEITCSQFLPVILAASKDSVPNVRLNVAKVLKSLASAVDQSVVEKSIRPCLNELEENEDADVQYYAKEALQAIDKLTISS